MIRKIFNSTKNNISAPEWLEYVKHFEEELNKRTPINKVTFTIVDVESTGLNSKKDKILSIGAVKLCNNEIDISDTFEIYIEQEINGKESIPIHGILGNNNHSKLKEREGLIKFLNFIGNTILVGHNFTFDLSIINNALVSNGFGKLKNKWIDTIDLYKRFNSGTLKNIEHISLDKACQEFRIPLSDRHNSAGDAYITAILFLKLVNRLEKRGVKTVGELLRRKRII